MSNIIYHYTNIETLSLILKKKTIRFNRLDKVDDLSEGDSFQKVNLSKFYFISCWTEDSEESIPLWKMYTNEMKGVRIGIPKDEIFPFVPINFPEDHKPYVKGELRSPLPFADIFGKEHYIFPNFMTEAQFYRKVEYDKNFVQLKNNAIKLEQTNDGKVSLNISDPTRIASVKSPKWKFQKESRFVLLIFPSFSDKGMVDKEWRENIPNYILQSLINGEGPNLNFYDVTYNKEILKDMTVTLGPKCNEGEIILVRSLLDKFAPEATLSESELSGSIR